MSLFCSMDVSRPLSLEEYCRHFDISIFDLNIPCIFCRFVLNIEHLASFANKTLSLIWRDNRAYACCISCARLSAKFESERYYQCSIRAVDIEAVLGKPLHTLIIRCCECLRLLDIVEKYDCVCRDGYFHVVRSSLKGLCRFCVPK